jgi:hypothetical protein
MKKESKTIHGYERDATTSHNTFDARVRVERSPVKEVDYEAWRSLASNLHLICT